MKGWLILSNSISNGIEISVVFLFNAFVNIEIAYLTLSNTIVLNKLAMLEKKSIFNVQMKRKSYSGSDKCKVNFNIV